MFLYIRYGYIKIYDLAVRMIELSGIILIKLNKKGDIEIQITGLRLRGRII